jgi:hypothetical protein
MKTIYYGRTSTNDGQTSASPYDEAGKQGVDARHVHVDEATGGYHVASFGSTRVAAGDRQTVGRRRAVRPLAQPNKPAIRRAEPGYVRADAHGSEGCLYSERSAL